MRHFVLACAYLSLALLAALHQVRAENNFDPPRPDLWCDGPYDHKHPLAFETLDQQIQFESLIERGDWQEGDRKIAEAFQQFVTYVDPNNAELAEFWSGLQYYLSEPIQNFARWQPDESAGQELKYELPVGDKSLAVSVQCEMISTDIASAAIAYTAAALYQSGETGHDIIKKLAAAKLENVYQTHRNRLFNGFPMWPWEMWINGVDIDFNTRYMADPAPAPRHQWVFMRPSLSPVLKFDGTDDSELDAGLVVEPAGLVLYTKDDYSSWIGVSPMVSITNSNGIGLGGLLRYGNWQLGAAYHDNDSDVLLYVSVDLYDFVLGKEKRTSSADKFLKELTVSLKKEIGQGDAGMASP